MYMKVNTSLCKRGCKPTGRQEWHGNFCPEVHVLSNTLVPVVSTIHLVVHWLIGTTPSPHVGCRKNPTDQVRVAQWHAQLELLFTIPVGWAQSPSQILLWSTAQSSRVLHDGELTNKPSRMWQLPSVTSTTDLQLDHLVPLDAIS